MHDITSQSCTMIRQKMQQIKTDSQMNRTFVEKKFEKIAQTWEHIKDETKTQEQGVISRITVDHELELIEIRSFLVAKQEEIDSLLQSKVQLTETCSMLMMKQQKDAEDHGRIEMELKQKIIDLEQLVSNANVDKLKAVNELKENMNREHKTEIESLRSRFKLMTNMERSPSDTSLEKIERPDLMFEQLTAHDISHGHDSGAAVPPAAKNPKLSLTSCSPKSLTPAINTEMFMRCVEEKEQQIEALRSREQILSNSNNQLRATILSLTDEEQTQKELDALRTKIETLLVEKTKLEGELISEKSKRMESSVTVEKRYLLK